jgi:hypothetical protein
VALAAVVGCGSNNRAIAPDEFAPLPDHQPISYEGGPAVDSTVDASDSGPQYAGEVGGSPTSGGGRVVPVTGGAELGSARSGEAAVAPPAPPPMAEEPPR